MRSVCEVDNFSKSFAEKDEEIDSTKALSYGDPWEERGTTEAGS
jgi:hypothetical protein